MTTETEAPTDRRLPIPPGVHLAGEARDRVWLFADIKIRCRRQAPGEAPWFARRRFAWNTGEVSGALGDLGTFLPHIVGAITVYAGIPGGKIPELTENQHLTLAGNRIDDSGGIGMLISCSALCFP